MITKEAPKQKRLPYLGAFFKIIWMAPRADALTVRLRYPEGVAVLLGFTHPLIKYIRKRRNSNQAFYNFISFNFSRLANLEFPDPSQLVLVIPYSP